MPGVTSTNNSSPLYQYQRAYSDTTSNGNRTAPLSSTRPGKDEKTKIIFNPFHFIDINLETTGTSDDHDIHVTVPTRCVPQVGYYNEPIHEPGTNASRTFNMTSSSSNEARFGLTLFSVLEAGIVLQDNTCKDNAAADNIYSNDYHTYWGGYAIGDYACIGSVNEKFGKGYYLKLKTPELAVGHMLFPDGTFTEDDTWKSLGHQVFINPFVSFEWRDTELRYRSGYHMYGTPFYGTVDDLSARTISGRNIRYGLSVGLSQAGDNPHIKFFLSVFGQNDKERFSLNGNCQDFSIKLDPKPTYIGWGIGMNIGF
jgi:hypothetical protein